MVIKLMYWWDLGIIISYIWITGINIPKSIKIVFSSWRSDLFSFGSYDNVSVGALGDDNEILAETLGEGRLFFFAGESTTRNYPATLQGAFLTRLREAAKVAHHASVWTLHLQVEKNKWDKVYFRYFSRHVFCLWKPRIN